MTALIIVPLHPFSLLTPVTSYLQSWYNAECHEEADGAHSENGGVIARAGPQFHGPELHRRTDTDADNSGRLRQEKQCKLGACPAFLSQQPSGH